MDMVNFITKRFNIKKYKFLLNLIAYIYRNAWPFHFEFRKKLRFESLNKTRSLYWK
jgi:hypothetical protein